MTVCAPHEIQMSYKTYWKHESLKLVKQAQAQAANAFKTRLQVQRNKRPNEMNTEPNKKEEEVEEKINL